MSRSRCSRRASRTLCRSGHAACAHGACNTSDEAAIQSVIDGLVTAIRTKNLAAAMSSYAPELVAFDIVPPLQFVGADAFMEPCFETIDYEVRDLRITAGDDIPFSHSLNRIHGTTANGQRTELWLRSTTCFRKLDGRWLIVHLQASVPVDLASGPRWI
jgi:ketosteroid isomerase-like protein